MPTRRRPLASPGCLALALVLAFCCSLALPALASASDYVVNALGDEYSPYGCEDFDECTLRTAISKSNEDEDEDTIEFEVEGTIALDNEPLPSIINPVAIDATTLPNYDGSPLIAIDGSNALSEGNLEGLSFLFGAGGSRVEGLAIGGFETGIFLAGGSSIYACANYIGVGLDGVTATPNEVGIDTGFHSPAQKIGSECWDHGGNLISGNESYGIVDFGTGTKIAENTIGLDVNGDPLPNGTAFGAGILVSQFAEEPYIGGFPGEEGEPGNVIAGNAGTGVLIESAASKTAIRRNSIFGNTELGIKIQNGEGPPVPQLESVSTDGTEPAVAWSFIGPPEAETYLLDLFVNEACDASGAGEGQEFLGTVELEADGQGGSTVLFSGLEQPALDGEIFTATLTATSSGATSTFSQCFNEAPDTVLETNPPAIDQSAEAAFIFSGDDPSGTVAGFECSVDGGPFAGCTSPKTLPGLSDGSHSFEVRAKDKAGKVDVSPAHYTWTVDATLPTVTLESEPSDPSNLTSASFGFSASDSGSGLAKTECRLDGGQLAPCSSPATYSSLADGDHAFSVIATDNAGNVNVASSSWTIDATAPETTIEAKPPDPSGEGGADFTFSGSDGTGTGVAGFECRVDGAPFAACTSPDGLSGLADGTHTFQVRAKDNAGNDDASPASYTWTVDTTVPQVKIEGPVPAPTSKSSSASFFFGGEDSGGSGVARFECRLDGGAFVPCTSPQDYEGLADGSHTFEVRAVDQVGNVGSTPDSYTWKVDTTATPQAQPLVLAAATTEASNGESVAVAPEAGKVFVLRPGQKKPTELKEGQTIPVGSIVDATNGKVLLTSVNAAGEEQSAVFYGGKFLVQQHDGSGLVILKLRGGDLSDCGGAARQSGATISGRKGRKLWGSGHGNFRTEGSYGSATVTGTIWFTEDRCNGTFFKVRRGVVKVRDFTNDKTVSLPAGKTYLAQP